MQLTTLSRHRPTYFDIKYDFVFLTSSYFNRGIKILNCFGSAGNIMRIESSDVYM